ncbi:MAG TPA: glycosyltransferase, partial [Pyrinomonadaceae bacterium]|nr:glycosyltransferase [Pyrinomonadaceae bacterium]
MTEVSAGASFLIIMPVFDDWNSVEPLLRQLDEELARKDLRVEVLLIDDGSTIKPPSSLASAGSKRIARIEILRLRRNLGHQRAIAIALAHIEEKVPCQAVVVMDADGEDKPEDAIRLIEEFQAGDRESVIFAQRARRAENFLFRASYFIYRRLYKTLTGQEIRIGNFSIIPQSLLRRIVVVSEIWNHYSSGILKARIPHRYIPADRSNRLAGSSRMNYVQLVVHGLSAISIYGDVIGVRALMATVMLALLSLVLILAAIVVRSATDLAIPGWATYVVG